MVNFKRKTIVCHKRESETIIHWYTTNGWRFIKDTPFPTNDSLVEYEIEKTLEEDPLTKAKRLVDEYHGKGSQSAIWMKSLLSTFKKELDNVRKL